MSHHPDHVGDLATGFWLRRPRAGFDTARPLKPDDNFAIATEALQTGSAGGSLGGNQNAFRSFGSQFSGNERQQFLSQFSKSHDQFLADINRQLRLPNARIPSRNFSDFLKVNDPVERFNNLFSSQRGIDSSNFAPTARFNFR